MLQSSAQMAHRGTSWCSATRAWGVAYLALSKVADAVFPTAPNPTPTARPSERDIKVHEVLGITLL